MQARGNRQTNCPKQISAQFSALEKASLETAAVPPYRDTTRTSFNPVASCCLPNKGPTHQNFQFFLALNQVCPFNMTCCCFRVPLLKCTEKLRFLCWSTLICTEQLRLSSRSRQSVLRILLNSCNFPAESTLCTKLVPRSFRKVASFELLQPMLRNKTILIDSRAEGFQVCPQGCFLNPKVTF